jgi:hypothetical protein
MSRTQQISKNGKVIFHMDFSNLNNVQDIKAVISDAVRYIRSKPEASVLTLTSMHGMHFSTEIKDLFNDFISGNKPYVKAGAVVGLGGLQQIVYNGLMKVTGRDIKSFSSIESAREWLVSRDKE